MKKRKTRQQKIITSLKRQLKATGHLKATKARKTGKKTSKHAENSPSNKELVSHPRLIKKDLLKTAALSISTIVLEILLYFLINKKEVI